MYESKITSKGQKTIPIEIRRFLNLKTGDKMSFEINQHGVYLDKSTKPLTIQERFENYDYNQHPDAMKEVDTGSITGEEEI